MQILRKFEDNKDEPAPKSRKVRHYEARSNLIILTVNMLRFLPAILPMYNRQAGLHFVHNDATLLFGGSSLVFFFEFLTVIEAQKQLIPLSYFYLD